jgi:hypothetical protein
VRRRRFSERQRVGMWWVYTAVCIAVYVVVFALSDFPTALLATCVVIAGLGLLIKWLSSL